MHANSLVQNPKGVMLTLIKCDEQRESCDGCWADKRLVVAQLFEICHVAGRSSLKQVASLDWEEIQQRFWLKVKTDLNKKAQISAQSRQQPIAVDDEPTEDKSRSLTVAPPTVAR